MAEWLALRDAATRAHAGRAVGVRDGVVLDHAAFVRRVAGWRNAFLAQSGSRWALHLDDTVEFAAALYGAWHAGKTATLCGDALPDTVARVRADVDGLAGDFPDALGAVCIAPSNVADADHANDWSALDEATTRLIVFTSGSTGDAAAIDKSLAQLAREVEALQQAFGEAAQDALVHGTVSHQHIYGLLFRVLWPLAAGRAIAPRLFFHDQIASALAQADCVLVSSPAHLKRIPDTIDWAPARARLRVVFSSGGALPEDAAVAARRQLGVGPTEIYGSSETGGIAWRQWRDDAPAWQALPGVSWRIADEQLEVSSPHLPTMEWWRSEDRVEADGSGFRLLGRADRIVKIEERRVSLSALERQLSARDDVREARVVALPGARVQLAAVVVLEDAGQSRLAREGRRAFAQQLGESLAQAHDAVARPRRWRFVEQLPMNAQGKATDAALRALFRPEQPVAHWMLRESATAELELDIDADLIAFDGHFPQAAILPGVAQLDWAVRFAREVFAMPPRFVRMEALKFQRVIRPGARVQLRLDWAQDKGALTFRYQSDRGPHASGRVLFAP